MAFNSTTRKQIYNNANGKCEKCGKNTPLSQGEAHHKTRVSSGGTDTASNGRWLCKPCHGEMYGSGH